MSKKLQFPENFLWGAATSAHQVEGGTNNQWTQWEKENAERLAKEAKTKWQPWQQEKFPEMFDPQNYISGKACDHYNKYEEDFDLAKEGGHNAHRFSIEWSRIEPEEGRFDEKEIEHYRKVILSLKERGLEPFVTLWHWTNPLWLEEKGGCESGEFVTSFSRYAKLMVENFGDIVKFWVTLNEPTSIISAAYMAGVWPPQKRCPIAALKVFRILSQAHNRAYAAMHEVRSDAQIGFANTLMFLEPNRRDSFLDNISVKIADHFANKKFLKMTEGNNDFLTLQYYFHNKISFPARRKNENKVVSDLGWEVYQEGICNILKWLGTFKLPIYITENGIADAGDSLREKFIIDSLKSVHQAIAEGVDVRGYFYWSLMDNFEWDKGFWPRFGLIEIDYKTLERKPRQSFHEYAKICKSNELNVEE